MGNRPNDMELERLRNEMTAAQEEMDRIKDRMSALNEQRSGIREEVGGVKARLAQLKQNIDREYDAMRAGFQQSDVQGANRHKRVAESLKQQLDAEYKKKDLCYEKLNTAKAEFESALEQLNQARDRKHKAGEAFHVRLEALKAANPPKPREDRKPGADRKPRRDQKPAKGKDKDLQWKQTTCKMCGKPVYYHIEWNKVPDLCHDCLEKEKAHWLTTPCKRCGKPIRYHDSWEHAPSICKACKGKR